MTKASPDDNQLRRELRARAATYYAEFTGCEVDVQLTASRQRRFSQTYCYRLQGGTEVRQVFVKLPIAGPSGTDGEAVATPGDRPRLVPVLASREEARLEYEALSRMHAHFADTDRLGAPRVLDLLEGEAIVVEAVDWPTLGEFLKGPRRLRTQRAREGLVPRFQATGSWLRTFHRMPAGGSSQLRLATREALVETCREFIEYLHSRIARSEWLKTMHIRFRDHACEAFSERLPHVCGHGDFGLHNVFAGPEQQVLGFDTLAYWQTSPFEDVAYFLLLLETLPPLFSPRRWIVGSETVTVCRRAFLEGYFGSASAPLPQLLPFEILVTLDKWASVEQSCHRARGWRRSVKSVRLALQRRWLRARIARLFQQLATPLDSSGNTVPPSQETAHVR